MPINKEEILQKITEMRASLSELESLLLGDSDISEDEIPEGQHLPQPEDN